MSGLKIGLSLHKKKSSAKPTVPKRNVLLDEGDGKKPAPTETSQQQGIEISSLDDVTAPSTAHKAPTEVTEGRIPKAMLSSLQAAPDLSALRSQHKNTSEAQSFDASVFDYDAHYDAIHANDELKKETARQEAVQRKPKYMTNLLASAEQRKRDQTRARDKLLQKEREAEGDDFADKDQFVTSAYKKQQEEARLLEQEEKKREEEEEKKRGEKGMTSFYRNMMDEQDKKHRKMMEAAAKVDISGPRAGVNTEEAREKTASEMARELEAQGRHVELNEEGEVVDKRQLLKGGLNVSATQKSRDAERAAAAAANKSADRGSAQSSADRDRGETRRAQRDRQTRMIEAQLEMQAKRAAEEEAEELQRRERDAKSRRTEGEVSSARERYLQRKREAGGSAAKAG